MSSSHEKIDGYEEYELLGIHRWYLDPMNRLARFLVKRLYVDPNVITLFGIGLAVWAAVCFARAQWLVATVLVIGTAFCDMIDGPVARAIVDLGKHRKAFSKRVGAIIDPIADRVCDIAFLAGLHWYASVYLAQGWASVVFWTMVAYLLSSWLRTFMGSKGYQVIQGKPLTRGIFFVALLIMCSVTVIVSHIDSIVAMASFFGLDALLLLAAVYLPLLYRVCNAVISSIAMLAVFEQGLLLLLASTVLPLLYRVYGGATAVWRVHNDRLSK